MMKSFFWIVVSASLFCGGLVFAQTDNPYLPRTPFSPDDPPFKNYNPDAIPQPLPPHSDAAKNPMPQPAGVPYGYGNPGMMPQPGGAPYGMIPYGYGNPGMMPQPGGAPFGMMPQANGVPYGNPGMMPQPNGAPFGMMPQPNAAPFGYGNPGAMPQPGGGPYGDPSRNPAGMPYGYFMQGPGNPGTFPPTPAPVNPNPGTFPPTPAPVNPNPGTFPPTPAPVNPNPRTFPPTPSPVNPNPGTFPPTPSPVNPNPGPSNPENGGATEPYLVPPEKTPTDRLPPVAPPSDPVVTLPPGGYPANQAISPDVAGANPIYQTGAAAYPPQEPYVLYEGPRYQSELKEENVHAWVQANYVHWWVLRPTQPPLATTGTAGGNGTLGNPDTVLVGNNLGATQFNGIQAYAGIYHDHLTGLSLEAGGLWLAQHGNTVNALSNATGNPAFSRPIQVPGESIVVVSSPGLVAGNLLMQSVTDMNGAELNLAQNLFRLKSWSVDYLAGFRYMYLHDGLTLSQNSNGVAGNTFTLPNVAGAVSNASITDAFNTTNRFYGGQLGARLNWAYSCFDVGVTGKLGMGATTQAVNIDGFSNLTIAGVTSSIHQGVLAQPTNIGQYNSTSFSFLPEVNATVGWRVSPHVRFITGYTGLLWSNVQWADKQIDRSSPNPAYIPMRSTFFAQGINIGVELRY